MIIHIDMIIYIDIIIYIDKLLESSIIVNGPSFSKEIFISAQKIPVATFLTLLF